MVVKRVLVEYPGVDHYEGQIYNVLQEIYQDRYNLAYIAAKMLTKDYVVGSRVITSRKGYRLKGLSESAGHISIIWMLMFGPVQLSITWLLFSRSISTGCVNRFQLQERVLRSGILRLASSTRM